ncbi:monooxygenase FAD-binding [Beutenbergia cavernae DSM 12333]|uniref:Monooxygenase FAD-binding n=1 Tax=Beutenbergia cavernae (strain ATCC BAA-8 / DSM 12333 / CCUG 43141 / JCM 11478 / NBRC 16432 / NCIMB 13614 / HKI 0122) TaxID=471853 RepID=C5BVV4_BEUC1|nr:FAD-dependent monooxygenase [Beutenbergia cavernae]ACQ80555.1 monooxygenase FAD-binding [Beutenbergia cavernae DSM 12333]
MTQTTPRVDVVGGGVAGLALAGMLPRSWDIHLHERARSMRTVPTALGIWPEAMAALDTIGVGPDVRRQATHLDRARMHDRAGRVLIGVTDQDVWLIGRTALLDQLWSALPPHVKVHEHAVTDPGGLPGDLVVGADGVHSVVRSALWPAARAPQRLGVTAIRGVIAEPVADGALSEFWAPGALFGMTPHPDGTNWFATVPARRFASRDEALNALRSRFSSHPGPVRTVLDLARPDDTLVNDLWESRWPRRLVRGRAVLVGDSAHAMSPNLGRGACESIQDAHALARALHEHPLPEALRRYERERLVRPQVLRTAARTMLRTAMTRHERTRNAFLSLVPARG